MSEFPAVIEKIAITGEASTVTKRKECKMGQKFSVAATFEKARA